MWWENLPYLDELCRSGTMAAAARGLRVNKATVSRRLAELARCAPAPLFERRNGQILLTAYGARAIDAYRDHEQSRRRLATQLEHTEDDANVSVRLTLPAFFACEIVAPALREFHAAHMHIDVQLDCSNRILDVARGDADVALRNLRPSGGSLSVRKVGRLGMATFASREYLTRRGELIAPRCLAGHEYISYDTGPYAGPGFEWMQEGIKQARVAFSANDALLLRAAAVSGLGLVTLPAFMGNETPQLRRVEDAGEGITDLWLVTREEQKRVTPVQAVRQFLAELVRKEQARLCPF
jgi:DNA-binding transcriptional LysR family regulator